MKKTISILLLCLVTALATWGEDRIQVYVTDSDSYTNVRNAPKGDVVYRLERGDGNEFMLEIDRCVDGW